MQFVWLVRDFSLKLVSNGREITSKEYLENSLAPISGDSAKVEEKNAIRRSIMQFFVDRTCVTMRRPVNDEALLQHMESVKDSDLRPLFVEELEAFISMVYAGCKIKRLFNENLNGASAIRDAT